jgi:hypothetical protein
MTSIFQIDWITVDTIIIVLLLLLLFSVKLFKTTYRWRYSFSNQALEYISLSHTPSKGKNQIISLKNLSLTRNIILKKNESHTPLIIILRKNRKRKLLRVFTEGLSSYGFNVINMKVKIKHITDTKTLKKAFIDEWKSLISNIMDNFKMTEVMRKPKYILITHSKFIISYKQILSDSNIKGVILINPTLKRKRASEYNFLFKNNSINAQIYMIFSGKSIMFFRNKHLENFLEERGHRKNNTLKHSTIKKATYSFKFYETIILSMLIDIIENKLLVS